MAIKRVTIEIDDAPDTAKATMLPASLADKKQIESDTRSTSTPEEQEDYRMPEGSEMKAGGVPPAPVIGRTAWDLIFTFINRPEFRATAITFLALVVFATKISSLGDFWLPVIASLLMNGVWLGVSIIKHKLTPTKRQ